MYKNKSATLKSFFTINEYRNINKKSQIYHRTWI